MIDSIPDQVCAQVTEDFFKIFFFLWIAWIIWATWTKLKMWVSVHLQVDPGLFPVSVNANGSKPGSEPKGSGFWFNGTN